VNQDATIEKAVFSVGAAPRLYNEDLRKPELELREILELAVLRIIEKNWQERIRLCREDFIVCCSYSVIVMNPFPGYD
jgi:hypothetical protein